MPDYKTLLDAQTWDFIARTNAAYPEDAIGTSVADQRRAYEAMCKVFYAGRPDVVAVTDVTAGQVPLRIYASGNGGPSVLYAHGGGFVVGGLDSHDDVCAEICAGTGMRVVAIDYRLSPEHQHPAAFQDVCTALHWLRGQGGDRIVLIGDSAGANLMAALAHAERGAADIAGQILIYPGLGGDRDSGSYLTHANAPMLTRDDVLFYETIRTGGDPPPKGDATFAPLQDVDFSDLPPTLAISAECDPLRDDGTDYCRKIHAAGGQALSIIEPGLVHGYLRARHCVDRAAASFARIKRATAMLVQGKRVTPAALG